MKDYSYIPKLDKIANEIETSPQSPLERFLSREQFLEFYRSYRLPLAHIAEGLGVYVIRVYRLRKKYGIQSTQKCETTRPCSDPYVFRGTYGPLRKKITVQELKRKYLIEKKSMDDIAKQFGVSRTAVYKYLKDAGVTTRSKRDARRIAMKQGKTVQPYCTINENFFSRWSQEMAWVLGLFLTDGCLHEEYFGNNRISIFMIDRDVIEKVRAHLNSTYKVIVKKTSGVRVQYGQSFISQRIYDDLLRLGLSPRKSMTVKMPPVPQDFIPDFARGVFEGDGSYTWSYQGPSRVFRISLTSGSSQFVHGFAKALTTIGMRHRKPYDWSKGEHKHFQLTYTSPNDMRLYYELAYKDTPASMCMDRKQKIIEEWYVQKFLPKPKSRQKPVNQKRWTRLGYLPVSPDQDV